MTYSKKDLTTQSKTDSNSLQKANAKQTVLVGLTGGVHSLVAAYLMKKQGFKVLGVTLQLFSSEESAGPFSEFAPMNLNQIKKMCESIDIPFYVINAEEEFKAMVLDRVVGRTLSGHHVEPIVLFNQLLIKLLLEKAQKKFQTSLICTGHFAKILKNQKTNVFELMVCNEIEFDQSYELSLLTKNELEHLILPLSELKKHEVYKIFDLLKIPSCERPQSGLNEIFKDPSFLKFVEFSSSADLRRVGSLYDHYLESAICEHPGIHHFYVGKNNINIIPEIKIEPDLQVISVIPYKGNVFLGHPSRLSFKNMLLKNLNMTHLLDTSVPIIGYVKFSPRGEKYEATCYFKNCSHAFLELTQEIEDRLLPPGSFVAFYHKKSEKGKILFSGTVEISGRITDGEDFYPLPLTNTEERRDENTKKKIVERLVL